MHCLLAASQQRQEPSPAPVASQSTVEIINEKHKEHDHVTEPRRSRTREADTNAQEIYLDLSYLKLTVPIAHRNDTFVHWEPPNWASSVFYSRHLEQVRVSPCVKNAQQTFSCFV